MIETTKSPETTPEIVTPSDQCIESCPQVAKILVWSKFYIWAKSFFLSQNIFPRPDLNMRILSKAEISIEPISLSEPQYLVEPKSFLRPKFLILANQGCKSSGRNGPARKNLEP